MFLGPDFHYVIYPVNPNGDLNFIAIMKHKFSSNEQKNSSLFSDENFIKEVIKKSSFQKRFSKDIFMTINNVDEIKTNQKIKTIY